MNERRKKEYSNSRAEGRQKPSPRREPHRLWLASGPSSLVLAKVYKYRPPHGENPLRQRNKVRAGLPGAVSNPAGDNIRRRDWPDRVHGARPTFSREGATATVVLCEGLDRGPFRPSWRFGLTPQVGGAAPRAKPLRPPDPKRPP